MIHLYNTLTRKKEPFVPSREGRAGIYVCGPTVYNYIHIGNARPFVIFDALRGYLEHKGYEVLYVQNFTDVDDKIIDKAISEGSSAQEVAGRFIDAYFQDARALGVRDADVHPKVSEHIAEIIGVISLLMDKGCAYESGGSVYFRVSGFAGYGRLSGQSPGELMAGARVDVDETKESPLDFALWKRVTREGEICWPSPWGPGRPGWHIECSAMSRRYIGETVDIHGGGQDLIFPHHENEIAQSVSAFGEPFALYWLHNGYINIDNVKMAKSGVSKTVRELRAVYRPEALRLFLLSAHYRGPVNFSDEVLRSCEASLDRLYTARDNISWLIAAKDGADGAPSADEEQALGRLEASRAEFEAQLDDDFNTANALTCLFDAAKTINSSASSSSSLAFLEKARGIFTGMSGLLGLLGDESVMMLDREIEDLIGERAAARGRRDFARSDEIRDELKARGVVLEDTKDGVKWRRV